MKDRRSFLKDVCPTVAFAFFGVSFLEACSSGDDDVKTTNPDTGNVSDPGSGNDTGLSVNGNTYTIDLTHSNFGALSSVGGWINGKSLGIAALLLRISNTEIKAFTNKCPHLGTDNRWELINNSSTFKCNQHGNSYSADCNSALTCFDTSISENTLTVTIS